MFNLVDPNNKGTLDLNDLKRISEQLKYNLDES